ncbi:hypothetical protein Tco_0006549 [Tanacetum coccineum]
MNVLSKKIDEAARIQHICLHPGCHDMNLTHLRFADDLMVFVEGDKWSIEGALAIFNDFTIHSGLSISLEKSTIYMAGIRDDMKEDILTDFPFEYGPDLKTTKAKVSWKVVCTTKEEGGLGCLFGLFGQRGFIELGVSDQTTLGEVMERDRGRIHRNALLNQVEHEILMLKDQRVHGQEDEFMWRLKDDTYSEVSIEGNMANPSWLLPRLGLSSRLVVPFVRNRGRHENRCSSIVYTQGKFGKL